jgi:predicted helicase
MSTSITEGVFGLYHSPPPQPRKRTRLIITNIIPCLDLIEKTQCFPLYVYDSDGSNRQLNVTPWALNLFRTRYGLTGDFYDQKADADDPAFGPASPWNVFHYTYALLHAKGYREKYEANLKKSLPRIPLPGDAKVFARLAELGEDLAGLHLNYEEAEPYELERIEKPVEGEPFDWACPKLRLDSKDKTVVRYNKMLTLTGVPPEALEYRLGNRSAVEWVCNQYKRYPAKDDFVVRLLERVITVSLRTVEKVGEVNEIWQKHAE